MKQRLNFFRTAQPALKCLNSLAVYLSKSVLEQKLLDLVYFRVSQINGCAYCLDMHSKDLRVVGESEQRLYLLNAWRETDLYTERERAALAFAEALTKLDSGGVSDKVYAMAEGVFDEQELIDLTMGILAINSYNRINIAFRTPAGSYQPGQHIAASN